MDAPIEAARAAADMTPSAYVQWLLAIVLLAGGALVAWSIRTIVNRFVSAMDKTEVTLSGIQNALVESQAATRALDNKIGGVAQPVLLGLQGVLGEFKATEETFYSRTEAAAEKRAAHLAEKIDFVHRDIKAEVGHEMQNTRHSLGNILTPIVLEMARRGAVSPETAERTIAKLGAFSGQGEGGGR